MFLNPSSIGNLQFSLLPQLSNATNSNRVTKRCPVARKETKERRREILIRGWSDQWLVGGLLFFTQSYRQIQI